ncbi:MAG: hypothetical protein IAE99_10990 [Rhodothermales bacterium]|nr:hypothetical protein [Rhodothermales bacterium]
MSTTSDAPASSGRVKQYFSDFFGLDPQVVEAYGAFNISLINDLPLFIDPFLLFNSEKEEYQRLHEGIIDYIRFLRDKSVDVGISKGLLDAWFRFPEVKQNWMGYSLVGNKGRGLGPEFALALHQNLNTVFANFGDEQIAKGSHLEKLCLINSGIGRDNISDFTTNLIKDYLLGYTQNFALKNLTENQRSRFRIKKVRYNYDTESWVSDTFVLPRYGPGDEDYVILVPKDILTKDDVWISTHGLFADFREVVSSISNQALRAEINNYFLSILPRKKNRKPPTAKEKAAAKRAAILKFPELIEYYIRYKEDHGDEAVRVSDLRVAEAENFFIAQVSAFSAELNQDTEFYSKSGTTYEECLARAHYMKDLIENKGCYRYFYKDGEPIRRESDLQIMYRLVWFGTPSDVSREVNDGRGPADFKVSRGAADKTIVEFKLASNNQLRRNMEKQVEIYQEASDAKRAVKVILYFTAEEHAKVIEIMNDLNLSKSEGVILIDGRADNKPSASKA